MTAVLGLSAYYHDSAACLVIDGEVVAAAQEERFSRKKHDHRFPSGAVAFCLNEAGIGPQDLDFVGFYDKPLLKFERLLETYVDSAPRGLPSFLAAMPLWLKEKLWLPDAIRLELARTREPDDPKAAKRLARAFGWKLLFADHHESHAASAFYPSPYEEATVLTVDGVGEWATASLGVGRGHDLQLIEQLRFPHSLGLLYSAFTYFTGFKVNSGEYKIMGLAPYGEPRYADVIRSHLLDLAEDGSFRLNQKYFTYATGLRMTGRAFETLLGAGRREPESVLTQREMDLARSVQDVTEEILLRMARYAHGKTGCRHLTLAGGVALNCVANGRLLREGPFDDIWIQPAAGDAGGALGVALAIWHRYLDKPRCSPERRGTWAPASNGTCPPYADGMRGSYLGPGVTPAEAARRLTAGRRPFRSYDATELPETVARLLADEQVVGLFQGRMEFGPRALGSRSILADPRSPRMQAQLNLKIKFRESFRPFAPAVLREDVADYFDLDRDSPYMLLVADVVKKRQRAMTEGEQQLWGIDKLNVPRSDIPAVTHVDYSARVQTVRRDTSPFFYDLLAAFKRLTGCAVLVNTSFNVRGEPIVCTIEDAYRCFMRTEMDALVIENCVLDKADQPPFDDSEDWRKTFELD